MAATAAEFLIGRRGIERGLVGTCLASALLHALALTLLLVVRPHMLTPPKRIESYTVDLVASDVIAGTNLVPGGDHAKPVPAKLAPMPPPALPVAEPATGPAVELLHGAPNPPPPAPPRKPAAVEPAPPAPAPAPPVAPPAEAKPAAVPPAPPAKPAEAEPAAAKPVEARQALPRREAEAKPAPPKPIDSKPPPEPAQTTHAAVKPAAKSADARSVKVSGAEKPAAKPQEKGAEKASSGRSAGETGREAAQRDSAIAAAVKRRASLVDKGGGGAQDSDKQIAAAVQRHARDVGGSAAMTPGPGGPIAAGPGAGTGGKPASLEYILYQGRMEQRIRSAWAWAGSDQALHAVIQFNLTPVGEIHNVRTIESSGDPRYDASCERAVRASSPLEPPPEKYRKEFSLVQMTFKPGDLEQ